MNWSVKPSALIHSSKKWKGEIINHIKQMRSNGIKEKMEGEEKPKIGKMKK